MAPSKQMLEAYEEVKTLYNLSESDIVCMTQLLVFIRMCGLSPKLTARLMKPLTALMEIMEEHHDNSKTST